MKIKVKLILVIAAVVIILAASLILINISQNSFVDPATNPYMTDENEIYFYEPDYELDITTVDEYMELDRLIYFKNGSETFGYTIEDAPSYNNAGAYFSKYFTALMNGDDDTLNTLYTADWLASNGIFADVAPQMVYDMNVEIIASNSSEESGQYEADVSYKIYENNGTFRRDIGSDAARVRRVTLITVDGQLQISRIQYYQN